MDQPQEAVLKIKKNDVFVNAETFTVVDENDNQRELPLTGTLVYNFHGDPDLAQYTFTTHDVHDKIQYFRKYEGEGNNFTSWTWKRYVDESRDRFEQNDRENDNIFMFEVRRLLIPRDDDALLGQPRMPPRNRGALVDLGGSIKKSKKKSKRKTNRSKKQKKQSKSRKQKKKR
jgi:hypothetical protein